MENVSELVDQLYSINLAITEFGDHKFFQFITRIYFIQRKQKNVFIRKHPILSTKTILLTLPIIVSNLCHTTPFYKTIKSLIKLVLNPPLRKNTLNYPLTYHKPRLWLLDPIVHLFFHAPYFIIQSTCHARVSSAV